MIEVHDILFPTDLSAASRGAFAHARLLAERLGARLTLYHAVEIPWQVYARESDQDAAVRERFAARARREMDEMAAGAPVAEMLVDTTVCVPSAMVDAALVELARLRRPDLIVMATHARTGLARAFIGSVTEQVLHHSGRPVLCVPPGESPRLPYRRLLVPTDFSPASRAALPWAALLAARFEAEVTVAHVPSWTAGAGDGRHVVSLPASEDVAKFVAGELAGQAVAARVVPPGRAWSGITGLAREWPADLIVMARRGHESIGDRILGGTAERVIRHGHVPVLVV